MFLSALREVCADYPGFWPAVHSCLMKVCISIVLYTSYMCELCCTVPLSLGLGLRASLMSICILYFDIV